jgi:beta-aspartyl-dipeptidase (metallo-type)
MICLLKNGQIFAPQPLGKRDILVAGRSLVALSPPGVIQLEGLDYQEIEAEGKIILPGFIDPHVHILGGGGEGGPSTRAPEIKIEDIIQAGVTTVIGCLGTDSVTRHMTSLYAKARALEIEGISTYIFSGAYDLPPVNLTGSIRKDLVIIDKVIGCGEVAISDHRSSQPSFEALARLAAECRVGGLLGGKAGILHLHLGDGSRRLEMVWRLIRETEIPITQIIPTHVNRNKELLLEALDFALMGGTIDLTALPEDRSGLKDVPLEEAISLALEKKVPLERITISSDANGSLPVFDSLGRLCGLTIATQKSLLASFQSLVKKKIISLDQAARLFSTNAACAYQLQNKGFLQAGYDADLIMFDSDLNLDMVMARGRLMFSQGKLLARSTFISK